MNENYRLNKYIAMCGICSRREADRLIQEGKVHINGEPALKGIQVSPSDVVEMEGRRISLDSQKKVVIAFYKPSGVVCTEKDKYADKIITDVLDYPVRVTYAGRLDKDAEGLLIMTNDGDLIERMMRGSNGHEKEYLVRVDKPVTNAFLRDMSKGIYLKDLDIVTRPCKIEAVEKDVFRIVLTQGVNRQIKRMSSALGFKVLFIKRIRVLNIELASLKPGEHRELENNELRMLYNKCGLTWYNL